jgi:hypothetical protein
MVHPYLCFKVVLLSLYGLLNFQSKLTFYFVIYICYKLVLLLVLFVYFLYRVLFVVRLVYNYSILLNFNSFYLFFNFLFSAKKFNINYLHNPNIVAVALSFNFNVMIHFKNYLCLNWLILVFSDILLILHLFIYELRTCVYYTKIFFNIQIYFIVILNYFILSLYCSNDVQVLKVVLFRIYINYDFNLQI